jgi:hypothetical protein
VPEKPNAWIHLPRFTAVRWNDGLGNVMVEVSQGLCKFFLPSGRSLHCVAEPRYAYFEMDYATTNGCHLPEEANSHAWKDVAINRDASYRDA